jgi:hypothetical protein
MPESGYTSIMTTLSHLVNLLEKTDPSTLSDAQRSAIEYYLEKHVALQVHRIKKGMDTCSLLRRSSTRAGIAI